MDPTTVEGIATGLFAVAIVHTFCVHLLRSLEGRFRKGSVPQIAFHLLGEVELVFGIWALALIAILVAYSGADRTFGFLSLLHFNEPIFVFVIMSMASTRPILSGVESFLGFLSRALPLSRPVSFYLSALVVGPLLGSLITEPAAMTVVALILLERIYRQGISPRFQYATLGLLFVNISIGGALTHYAAPPILMVAGPWEWDTAFVFSTFGWRSVLACVISAALTAFLFRGELNAINWKDETRKSQLPIWVIALHLGFLAGAVYLAHQPLALAGLFLVFLGAYRMTLKFQKAMKVKDALFVALFLAGLVVLGSFQGWWLEPLLSSVGSDAMFWGTVVLTAITDNAALTYLGTKVPTLNELARVALVSGAIVGGGLTVIANAPNPAGYGILNPAFKGGIRAGRLLLGALGPTLIAAICLWLI